MPHFYHFILCILSIGSLAAQNITLSNYSVGPEQGMSNRWVNSVLYASEDFVWIGTNFGLNRYDGVKFQSFIQNSSQALANQINQLQLDPNGNIWLVHQSFWGNKYYIEVIDPQSLEICPLSDYIKDSLFFAENKIKEVTPLPSQELLVGTTSQRVYRYDGKQFALIDIDLRPDETIQKIRAVSNHEFWVNTEIEEQNYLCRYNEKGNLLEREAIPDMHRFIPFGKALLCYTRDGKPYLKKVDEPLQKHESLVPNSILWAYNKEASLLIFRRDDGELTLTDAKGKIVLTEPGFFKKHPYRKWLADRDGFWLFNGHEGLLRLNFRESNFETYLGSLRDSLTYNRPYGARGLVQDEEGRLLTNGLFTSFSVDLSTQKFQSWGKEEFVYPEKADCAYGLAFLKDRQGRIWRSDERKRVSCYDPSTKQFQHYAHDTALSFSEQPRMYWALFQSSAGTIWVGHNKGLSWLEEGSGKLILFDQYNEFEQLAQSTVFHFHQNESGVWLATSSGLYLLDLEKGIQQHYYVQNQKLPHNHINHIYEDQDGFFWLATKGGGLIKWSAKSQESRQFTSKQGLSHDITYAVYEDDYNCLWISSDRGIMRFDKATEQVTTYLEKDGILYNEFNTISHYRSEDGRIFFGGIYGVTSFHPKDFQPKKTESLFPLRITAFRKRDEGTGEWIDLSLGFDRKQPIIIRPQEKSFELDLALLDYRNPKQNAYAYKIDGIDRHWNHLHLPSLTINQLPYGNFDLHIKAKDSADNWREMTLRIKVERPFYATFWFALLLIAALILGGYSFFAWRLNLSKKRNEQLEKKVAERTLKIQKDKQLIDQQRLRLQELDQLKNKLFTNITHELKTPLTLIIGPLSELVDNPSGLAKNEPFAMNILKTSLRNSQNLLQTINEILELSKIDDPRHQTLEQLPTNLHTFVTTIFDNFEPLATQKIINYRLDCQVDSKTTLLLDQRKVKKIIDNLILNALKFTPPEGSVLLEVLLDKEMLIVKVTDTGVGISPEDLTRIFDRFFQSHNSQPNPAGIGVGLALSKELASLLGGDLLVESKLKKGSQFSLKIPAQTSKELIEIPQLKSKIQASDNKNTANILVVEDNPEMRDFVQHILQQQYNTIAAADGVEALECLEKQPVDLIVSDISMPNMDGMSLLKEVRKNKKWTNIPMVMLTALSQTRKKINAFSIGADDYLTKPFSVGELLVRVQKLLENSAQRKASLTQKPVDEKLGERDKQWIELLHKITLQNIDDTSFNVAALAQKVNMSKRTLERELKRVTGLPPAKYIRELRLQKAYELLHQGVYATSYEVGYAVGINTPHHFSKLFFERFGKTPSACLK